MTEKQKMLSEESYNSSDPALLKESQRTKELLIKINNSADVAYRRELIRELMPHADQQIILISPFHCEYGSHITLGRDTFVNANCVFLDCAPITIGTNAFIAPAVQIYAATHPTDYLERRTVEYAKAVTIGNDCWIGGGAIICPGVTIGDRCIVAAGSVVIRDVPSDSLVAGNPAKIKRKLNHAKVAEPQ